MGPYRVWQSMSSHVDHRSYDFADHSMSCLSSPALISSFRKREDGQLFILV